MGRAPAAITFAVTGPIGRDDLPGLRARVCALLSENRGAEVAYCDVRDVTVNAATVDALARLQLGARHYGCRIRLRHASEELLALVAFMGLENVLEA
jgi:ABC-type transporter Mla MlaB component